MQYFGYLRRNPDDAPDNNFAGYNFWSDKLDQFNGDYIGAEMVKSFIVSGEYRQRFGQPEREGNYFGNFLQTFLNFLGIPECMR